MTDLHLFGFPKFKSDGDNTKEERKRLAARVSELEKALREIVPQLECGMLHHKPSEYHKGFDCPVVARLTALIQ